MTAAHEGSLQDLLKLAEFKQAVLADIPPLENRDVTGIGTKSTCGRIFF